MGQALSRRGRRDNKLRTIAFWAVLQAGCRCEGDPKLGAMRVLFGKTVRQQLVGDRIVTTAKPIAKQRQPGRAADDIGGSTRGRSRTCRNSYASSRGIKSRCDTDPCQRESAATSVPPFARIRSAFRGRIIQHTTVDGQDTCNVD